jgi:hypothetical protein
MQRCEINFSRNGENVKTVNLLKALGIALCVATVSSAYAQSSDAMASGSMAAPAANPKAAKKVDRKLGLDVRKALSKAQGFDVSNVDWNGARWRADPASGGSGQGRCRREIGEQQADARHAGRRRRLIAPGA